VYMLSRDVPDFTFPNPAGLARFVNSNPAGARTGAGFENLV